MPGTCAELSQRRLSGIASRLDLLRWSEGQALSLDRREPGVLAQVRHDAGLYALQELGSPADPQDMTRNDEPIYEMVKSEHNWDPERREPLGPTNQSVGRHRG